MPTSPITFGRTVRQWRGADFVVTETLHPAGFRLAPHDHERPNVTIALRGGFEERVESRSYSMQRGDVIVKPAGARHANAYGTAHVECITVETSAHLSDVRHFRSPPLVLLAERLRDDPSGSFAAEELASAVAGVATRREPKAEWLRTVEEMLREEPRSLAALGAVVGRHPTQVARAFRARYGCSIGQFVHALRIDAAREALRTTRRPIAEIAFDAGFFDQSHFTNVFRRLTGTTPARYRSRTLGSSKTIHRPGL